ncbi:hypothetical protein ACOTEN_32530 [Achromobacter xylosoxidans]|jgi:hypothetical protein
MKLLIATVSAIAFFSSAYAAPSREAADAWLKDFSQVKGDSLAEAKTPKAYLASQSQRMAELEDRAKILFTDKSRTPNPLAICRLAALRYRSAMEWQMKALSSDIAVPEVLVDRVSYLASTSFDAGAAYQSCEAAIEELK